jgi:adenosylmethionine-8-amino-7-oxononanoate aminotransferase
MGNPLACAVANASLDILLGTEAAPANPGSAAGPAHCPGLTYPAGWQAEVGRIEARLRAGLAPVAGLPAVADVRVLGAIGVVQLNHDVNVAAATAAAVRAGVWLRPFRDLVYTMPPYVTSDEDLALICDGVLAAARALAAVRC